MENSIIYRKIKQSDYKFLENIISDTWEFNDFCSAKNAKRMARVYLRSTLAEQTFTCVAENNGEPVGIIMGSDERKRSLNAIYLCLLFFAIAAMTITKEGRSVLKMFGELDAVNQEMLSKNGINFDGQVVFFAVKSDQRGLGIGAALFSKVIAYMKSKNLKNFYLYSDSSCNYKFYENWGMTRVQDKEYNIRLNSNEFMQLYIYAFNDAF